MIFRYNFTYDIAPVMWKGATLIISILQGMQKVGSVSHITQALRIWIPPHLSWLLLKRDLSCFTHNRGLLFEWFVTRNSINSKTQPVFTKEGEYIVPQWSNSCFGVKVLFVHCVNLFGVSGLSCLIQNVILM